MLVRYILDSCLVIIYTVLFISMVYYGYWHVFILITVFAAFTVPFNQLLLFISCSDSFLMDELCADVEIALKISHCYYYLFILFYNLVHGRHQLPFFQKCISC